MFPRALQDTGLCVYVWACQSFSVCWCQQKEILDSQRHSFFYCDDTITHTCARVSHYNCVIGFLKSVVCVSSVQLSYCPIIPLFGGDFSYWSAYLLHVKSKDSGASCSVDQQANFLKARASSVGVSTVVQPTLNKKKDEYRGHQKAAVQRCVTWDKWKQKVKGSWRHCCCKWNNCYCSSLYDYYWLLCCDVTTVKMLHVERLLVWFSRSWGWHYCTQKLFGNKDS